MRRKNMLFTAIICKNTEITIFKAPLDAKNPETVFSGFGIGFVILG